MRIERLALRCFCLVALLLTSLVVSEDVEDTHTFQVKPDVADNVASVLVDHEGRKWACIFEYLAEGGSSEEWMLDFIKEDNGVQCSVERPHPPSYLLFERWTLTLKGPAKTRIISAHLEDNDGKIDESMYTIQKRVLTSSSAWKEHGLVKIEVDGR